MASVYIFPEHENYQAGKTSLRKAAVPQTPLVMVFAIYCCGLFLLHYALVGFNKYYREFLQTTGTARGEIIVCEFRAGQLTYINVYLTYRYRVNGVGYVEWERIVDSGEYLVTHSFIELNSERHAIGCKGTIENNPVTVFYSLENPDIASIRASVSSDDLFMSLLYFIASLLFILKAISKLLKNRQAKQRYTQLKVAELILEAKITKTVFQRDKEGKVIARSAKYQFTDPDGKLIKASVKDYYSYKLPEQLEIGDTLYILFRDKKTYCIL